MNTVLSILFFAVVIFVIILIISLFFRIFGWSATKIYLGITGISCQYKHKRILYAVVTFVLLSIEFLVFRYVLFNLHGMIDLPFWLFVFCVAVILVSAFWNSIRTMVLTVVGYEVGSFLGLLFERTCIDEHGASRSDLWIWFVAGIVACVMVGIIWEIISRAIRKYNN